MELRVRGAIPLSQFWPDGKSDADTAKVLVNLGAQAFQYRPVTGGAFRQTHAFRHAKIKGKPVINKKNQITIRLQGIDAPELHYRAPALARSDGATAAQRAAYNQANREFRQCLAETGTVALRDLLRRAATNGEVPCTVWTQVEEPGDAFDVYGRLVGDIEVRVNGRLIVLNRWLIEQAWAFPAFYNSMTREEIRTLLQAAQRGKARSGRVWSYLRASVPALNWNRLFRKVGSAPDPQADKGDLALPKLFRRQTGWAVGTRVHLTTGSFKKFLRERKDACHLTSEFLQQTTAAPIHTLDDFLKDTGTFTKKPEDLVFREKASTLVGANGQEITRW
jgi:endonuclease YncB( thermonuclease family)